MRTSGAMAVAESAARAGPSDPQHPSARRPRPPPRAASARVAAPVHGARLGLAADPPARPARRASSSCSRRSSTSASRATACSCSPGSSCGRGSRPASWRRRGPEAGGTSCSARASRTSPCRCGGRGAHRRPAHGAPAAARAARGRRAAQPGGAAVPGAPGPEFALTGGLGMLAAAANVFFRDVGQRRHPWRSDALLRSHPSSSGCGNVPERFQWVMRLNPLTSLSTPRGRCCSTAARRARDACVVPSWAPMRRRSPAPGLPPRSSRGSSTSCDLGLCGFDGVWKGYRDLRRGGANAARDAGRGRAPATGGRRALGAARRLARAGRPGESLGVVGRNGAGQVDTPAAGLAARSADPWQRRRPPRQRLGAEPRRILRPPAHRPGERVHRRARRRRHLR